VKCAAPREIMILYLLTFPQADAKPRPARKMKEREKGGINIKLHINVRIRGNPQRRSE